MCMGDPLYCTVLHYTSLWFTVVHYNLLWLTMVHNSLVLYGTHSGTKSSMVQEVRNAAQRLPMVYTRKQPGSLFYFIAHTRCCKKFYGTHRATGCCTEVEFWYINCGIYYWVWVGVHRWQFHVAGALSGEKSHPVHHEGASPKSLGRKMRESVRRFCVENEISGRS